MSVDPAILKPGDRVGEYLLDEKLGSGGFGDVWRARHNVWKDRVVALKIPLEEEYIRRLRKEADLQHRVESPHVAKMLGIELDGDVPFLAMEYVRGRDLRKILKERKRLPQRDAINILLQAAAGLKAAHDKGVAHRDIKPENILVTDKDLVKLTDFGLGRLIEETSKSLHLSGTLVTATNAEISGTLVYMSPEQEDPELPVDERTDVYSLGVVMFELLTGSRPQGAEVPSDLAPELDRRLDAVFKKCYARQDKRYQKIDDLMRDLRAVRKGEPTLPKPDEGQTPAAPAAPGSKSVALRRVPAFLIDVAIIIAAAWLVSLMFETTREMTPREMVISRDLRDIRPGMAVTEFPWLLFFFFIAVLGFVYSFLFCTAARGRTIGKRLLGLMVITHANEPLDARQAAIRTVSYAASFGTLGFGFLMPFINEDGLALHDTISETAVVKAEAENRHEKQAENPGPYGFPPRGLQHGRAHGRRGRGRGRGRRGGR